MASASLWILEKEADEGKAVPEEGAVVWCLPNMSVSFFFFLGLELLFKQTITMYKAEEKGAAPAEGVRSPEPSLPPCHVAPWGLLGLRRTRRSC